MHLCNTGSWAKVIAEHSERKQRYGAQRKRNRKIPAFSEVSTEMVFYLPLLYNV